MRRPLLVTTVSLVVSFAACSSGSSHPAKANAANACTLVARLDDTAASVARANVADPVAFQRTLDTAAKKYVDTVDALRPLVPLDVRSTLDRLAADVQQRRFDDALNDRGPLDTFAARACGHGATTTIR